MGHLYRELSFFITPVFLKCAISANTASYISFSIGVCSALIICFGYPYAIFLGILLFFLSETIDRVDGNISRIKGTSTFYGKFIDGFFGIVTLTLLRLALCFHVYLFSYSILLFWIGVIAVVLTPFHHLIFDRYSAYARWINEEKQLNIKPYIRKNDMVFLLNVFVDLQYIALIVALFNLTSGLYVYFLINIILSNIYIFKHLRAVYKNMNVKKISPKLANGFQVIEKNG